MPINIKKTYGRNIKEHTLYTKEELDTMFGGSIIQAAEAVGKSAELEKRLDNIDSGVGSDIIEAFTQAGFYYNSQINQINDTISDLLDGKLTLNTSYNEVVINEANGIVVTGYDRTTDPDTPIARTNIRGDGTTSDGISVAGIHIQKNLGTQAAPDWKTNFWVSDSGDIFMNGNLQMAEGSVLVGTREDFENGGPGVFIDPNLGLVVQGDTNLSTAARVVLSGQGTDDDSNNYSGLLIQGWDDVQSKWTSNFLADPSGNILMRGEIIATAGTILGDLDVEGSLSSLNYDPIGETGWIINGNGSATFYGDIVADGSITASKLNVSDLSTISVNTGDLTVSDWIRSDTYVATDPIADRVGFSINADGTAEFQEIILKGQILGGSTLPDNIVTTGTINEGAITANKLIESSKRFGSDVEFTSNAWDNVQWNAGTITFEDTTTASINAGSFTLPDNSYRYFYYDGTAVIKITTDISITTSEGNIFLAFARRPPESGLDAGDRSGSAFVVDAVGKLTLTGDNIAAQTIKADKLSVNTLSAITADLGLVSAGQINVLGTGGTAWVNPSSNIAFAASSSDLVNAEFSVAYNGALTATNATIAGDITADSGSILGELSVGNPTSVVIDGSPTAEPPAISVLQSYTDTTGASISYTATLDTDDTITNEFVLNASYQNNLMVVSFDMSGTENAEDSNTVELWGDAGTARDTKLISRLYTEGSFKASDSFLVDAGTFNSFYIKIRGENAVNTAGTFTIDNILYQVSTTSFAITSEGIFQRDAGGVKKFLVGNDGTSSSSSSGSIQTWSDLIGKPSTESEWATETGFDERYFELSENLADGDASIIKTNLGLVIGVNVQAWDAQLDTFASFLGTKVTAMKNITTAEYNQVANIDTNTISNTQWGYLGELDQALKTTDSVDFLGVDASSFTVNDNGTANQNLVIANAGLISTLRPNGQSTHDFKFDERWTFVNNMEIESGGLYMGTAEVIDTDSNIFANELDVTSTAVFDSTLSSPSAVSRVSGWQGNEQGDWDFRSIFADTLVVKAFTADVAQAFRGSRFLSKSFATMAEDFSIPAVGSDETVTVNEIDGYSGLNVFEQGDYILFNVVNQSGGGLTVGEVWGEITSTIVDNGDGTQTFQIFIRHLSSPALEGLSVNEGSEALSFGSPSSPIGFIMDTVLDNIGSPYSQVVTWTTNPWDRSNWTVRTRTGNLEGITNASGYGFYGENTYLTGSLLVGDLSKTNDYLEYSDGDLTFVGSSIDFQSGTPTDKFILTDQGIPIDGLVHNGFQKGLYFGDFTNPIFDPPGPNSSGIFLGVDSNGNERFIIGNNTVGDLLDFTVNGSLNLRIKEGTIEIGSVFSVDSSTNTGTFAGWNIGDSICYEYGPEEFLTLSTNRTDKTDYVGFSLYKNWNTSNANNFRLLRIGELSGKDTTDGSARSYGIQIGRGLGQGYEDIFRIDQDGEFIIRTPKLTIEDGNATFSGALNAASGSFTGSLMAATGTFTGQLSAVTGTLGDLEVTGNISNSTQDYVINSDGISFALENSITLQNSLTWGVQAGTNLTSIGARVFNGESNLELKSKSISLQAESSQVIGANYNQVRLMPEGTTVVEAISVNGTKELGFFGTTTVEKQELIGFGLSTQNQLDQLISALEAYGLILDNRN